MKEERHDPWRARLSERIDGELGPEDAAAIDAHLATCAGCRAILAALERVKAAAGGLADRGPERDLWPAIASDLGVTPRSRGHRAAGLLGWSVALAAGLAAGLALGLFLRGPSTEEVGQVAGPGRYLLLLREPVDFHAEATPAEVQEIIGRYRNWAQGVGAEGRLEAGEKLSDELGWILRDEGGGLEVAPMEEEHGGIGGFFLIRAGDPEEALRVARTCPHLEGGGWIELRAIEDTNGGER